jgi:uncharacterized RDD family membrane protein YckC
MAEEANALWPPRLGVSVGAGFWIRALARIIDLFFLTILAGLTGFFCGILLVVLERAGQVAAGWQEQVAGITLSGFVLGILGDVMYHTLTEGIYGASVGKLVCGLRVVRVDGKPCDLMGATIRNWAYLLDSFFFGLIGYQSMKKSALRQRYGDVWAKTVVVRTKDLPDDYVRSRWLLAWAWLLGSGAWVATTAFNIFYKVWPR